MLLRSLCPTGQCCQGDSGACQLDLESTDMCPRVRQEQCWTGFSPFFGSHPEMSTQESFLVGSGDHVECRGSNPGQLCSRQGPYPTVLSLKPDWVFFFKNRFGILTCFWNKRYGGWERDFNQSSLPWLTCWTAFWGNKDLTDKNEMEKSKLNFLVSIFFK